MSDLLSVRTSADPHDRREPGLSRKASGAGTARSERSACVLRVSLSRRRRWDLAARDPRGSRTGRECSTGRRRPRGPLPAAQRLLEPIQQRDLGRLDPTPGLGRIEPCHPVDLRERLEPTGAGWPGHLEGVGAGQIRDRVRPPSPRRARSCLPSGRSSRAPATGHRPDPGRSLRRTRASRSRSGLRPGRVRPSGSSSGPRRGSRRAAHRDVRAGPPGHHRPVGRARSRH